MKVLLLTGSHPRHAFVARVLKNSGFLSGLIIEDRPPHIPEPPPGLPDDLKSLYELHFRKRANSEAKFFGDGYFPETGTLKVTKDNLNSGQTREFIRDTAPELLLSYGVHRLENETLNCCKGEKWNIHGGLSPWYRGSITHFWPSYLMEPQMTGMTIHDLSQELDAGDVIHQTAAGLVKGDGLHDLSCRAVETLEKDLPQLIGMLAEKKAIHKTKHRTSGRLWTSNDWRPEHLRLIYETYEDRIVDLCLQEIITGRIPDLIRQF